MYVCMYNKIGFFFAPKSTPINREFAKKQLSSRYMTAVVRHNRDLTNDHGIALKLNFPSFTLSFLPPHSYQRPSCPTPEL